MDFRIFPLPLAVLLLAAAGPLTAAAQDPRYDAAEHHLTAGENAAACRIYEGLLQEEKRATELHYNLGVCYFRDGHYPKARDHFTHLTSDPVLAQAAVLNLGLIAERSNDPATAISHYRKALHGNNPQLQELAARHLERLDSTEGEAPAGRLGGALALHYGSDDNVIDPNQLTATRRQDNFTDLTAALRWRSPAQRWLLHAELLAIDYTEVDPYDTLALRAGVGHRSDHGVWRLEPQLLYTRSWLDHTEYQGVGSLGLDLWHRAGTPRSLRLRLQHHQVDALDPAYDYLEGTRQILSLKLYRDDVALHPTIEYGYEQNARHDYTGATTFSSYSPHYHHLELTLRYRNGPWQLRPSLEWRTGSFHDDNLLADGSTLKRKDTRWKGGLELDYRLAPDWRLTLEYNQQQNGSNIDSYDYRRNLLLFGVGYNF